MVAEAWPSICWTALTSAPAAMPEMPRCGVARGVESGHADRFCGGREDGAETRRREGRRARGRSEALRSGRAGDVISPRLLGLFQAHLFDPGSGEADHVDQGFGQPLRNGLGSFRLFGGRQVASLLRK